jgi:TonB family protein
MVESQTRFGKPSWASEAPNGNTREDEQAVDFKFFITWSSVFASLAAPKDAIVPVNHRVPTLVSNSKELAAQRETRNGAERARPEEENSSAVAPSGLRSATALAAESLAIEPGVEKLPSAPRPEPDSSFNVAWEMVVPKMVRSMPKAPALESKSPAVPIEKKKLLPADLKRVWIGLAITVVGILLLLLLHHFISAPKQAAPASASGSALKLEAEPQPNGLLNIRWNPASAPVARAREGRLVIMERDQPPRELALTTDQLRSGHLSFQPLGDRVVFRLEVVDASGAVVKDSVLAQSSSVPVATSTPEPPRAAPAASAKLPGAPQPEAKTNALAPATTSVAQPARPARQFTPPPAPQHSVADARTALPDPPATMPSASAIAPLRIPDPGERSTQESMNRIPPPKAKAIVAVPPVKVGGDLQSAKLIRKVTPVYPQMAQVAHMQGTVRFTAIIGKDGTIQNLKVVYGPALLVKAAADAVKQWVYKPTVLNGQPMEVQTQIEVNFTLNK